MSDRPGLCRKGAAHGAGRHALRPVPAREDSDAPAEGKVADRQEGELSLFAVVRSVTRDEGDAVVGGDQGLLEAQVGEAVGDGRLPRIRREPLVQGVVEGPFYMVQALEAQLVGEGYSYTENDLIAAEGSFDSFNREQQASIIEHYWDFKFNTTPSRDTTAYEPYAAAVFA